MPDKPMSFCVTIWSSDNTYSGNRRKYLFVGAPHFIHFVCVCVCVCVLYVLLPQELCDFLLLESCCAWGRMSHLEEHVLSLVHKNRAQQANGTSRLR